MNTPFRLKILLLACSVSFVGTATADEVVLLEAPVKVTATLHALDEGGYAAQIGIHSGPVAQLVNTAVAGSSRINVEKALRQQVQLNTPYLFVHSTCGAVSRRQCEGEVIFKINAGKATRLGDFVSSVLGTYKNGHFYDVYDKLGEQPEFVIALDDVDGALIVNPVVTWSSNAGNWHARANQIATAHPSRDWSEAEWQYYFSAVLNNAALARYCNQADELQSLLNSANAVLDADYRRRLADALSKVVPLEMPKAWRVPY